MSCFLVGSRYITSVGSLIFLVSHQNTFKQLQNNYNRNTHTHTHTYFFHQTLKIVLACPAASLVIVLHFFLTSESCWNGTKLFIISLIQSEQVVVRRPSVPLVSSIINLLIQSASLHSTYLNQPKITHLVTNLIGSNPNSCSPIFAFSFFFPFYVNLHIRQIIFISVLSNQLSNSASCP